MRLIRRLLGAVARWRHRAIWRVDMETARRLAKENHRPHDS